MSGVCVIHKNNLVRLFGSCFYKSPVGRQCWEDLDCQSESQVDHPSPDSRTSKESQSGV